MLPSLELCSVGRKNIFASKNARISQTKGDFEAVFEASWKARYLLNMYPKSLLSAWERECFLFLLDFRNSAGKFKWLNFRLKAVIFGRTQYKLKIALFFGPKPYFSEQSNFSIFWSSAIIFAICYRVSFAWTPCFSHERKGEGKEDGGLHWLRGRPSRREGFPRSTFKYIKNARWKPISPSRAQICKHWP